CRDAPLRDRRRDRHHDARRARARVHRERVRERLGRAADRADLRQSRCARAPADRARAAFLREHPRARSARARAAFRRRRAALALRGRALPSRRDRLADPRRDAGAPRLLRRRRADRFDAHDLPGPGPGRGLARRRAPRILRPGVPRLRGRDVIVETFPVGMLQCNCTILGDEASGEAIVIDGGDEVAEIARRLDARGLKPRWLVHTHAHIDHIGALGPLRERVGGAGLLHHADRPLYATLAEQALWLGLVTPPEVVGLDGDLADGDVLRAGALALRCVHTPGHTPGSTSFALDAAGATTLFTGDTLFAGSVGRWDLGGTS